MLDLRFSMYTDNEANTRALPNQVKEVINQNKYGRLAMNEKYDVIFFPGIKVMLNTHILWQGVYCLSIIFG